jgi:serine/threonine protein kinase
MGSVYLVENTALRRQEALKVPHFETDDLEARKRFEREAQSAAGLDHPNLCPVYHVGQHDGIWFLTMRYLQGRLLAEYAGRPRRRDARSRSSPRPPRRWNTPTPAAWYTATSSPATS